MKKFSIKLTCVAVAAMAGATFQAHAADLAHGKKIVEEKGCVACHGADFNSPIQPVYPKLAGQHADYLEHALRAYKRGAKATNGRGNATMGGMAAQLDDKDIPDVAAYLASLKGTLVTEK